VKGWRQVATAALASVSGAAQLAARAGRERGRELAADPPPGDTAVERLVTLLGEGGFEPAPADRGNVAMHRCPLRTLADAEPAVVCSLHRGIVEGFLERAGPELRLVGFEPQAAPRPCVLRVEARSWRCDQAPRRARVGGRCVRDEHRASRLADDVARDAAHQEGHHRSVAVRTDRSSARGARARSGRSSGPGRP
jgi:hypothetical protein